MLSIGEFSKICKVTTRTLRHYDDINLIKPKLVNEENGYRYYEVDQIRDMLLVSRLKGYNFSLEEIKKVLEMNNREFTLEKIMEKEKKIEKMINDFFEVEKQMKYDILRLKKGFDIMSFVDEMEVTILNTEDMNIVSTRQHMSVEEYGKYIGKVFEIIAANKLNAAGSPMSIYYDDEFDEKNNDTEVAVPVKESNEFTRTFKGCLCAMTKYKGSYSGLSNGYGRIIEWIEKNGYEIDGHPFEKYINGPMDEGETLTEIYFPIRNAGIEKK